MLCEVLSWLGLMVCGSILPEAPRFDVTMGALLTPQTQSCCLKNGNSFALAFSKAPRYLLVPTISNSRDTKLHKVFT